MPHITVPGMGPGAIAIDFAMIVGGMNSVTVINQSNNVWLRSSGHTETRVSHVTKTLSRAGNEDTFFSLIHFSNSIVTLFKKATQT